MIPWINQTVGGFSTPWIITLAGFTPCSMLQTSQPHFSSVGVIQILWKWMCHDKQEDALQQRSWRRKNGILGEKSRKLWTITIIPLAKKLLSDVKKLNSQIWTQFKQIKIQIKYD